MTAVVSLRNIAKSYTRGKQRVEVNVRAALELVGISDRRSHKPAELSGGQQQQSNRRDRDAARAWFRSGSGYRVGIL